MSDKQTNQPRQQPAQPPNEQQAQYRRSNSKSERSTTDILSEDSGQQFLKYIIGVFSVIGLGYGIGLVLLDSLASDDMAIIGFAALFVPILGAPIISMVTGLLTGLRLDTDEHSAALASAVGSFIGFIILLLIILVFASIVSDGGSSGSGGGGGGLNELLGPLFAFGTGVAISGAGTTYVVRRIGI